MRKYVFVLFASACFAMDHGMHGMYGSYPMGRDATGTSWMPSSTQMPGILLMPDNWLLMTHGYAMGIWDDQGGPKGDEKFFSENMFMFTAEKDIAWTTFALRSMISFEPATIGCNGYPLLLQTGETCNGKTPLVNRQHPHDFLMELAAVYTLRLSDGNSLFAYFGYPGEPALGPPAYIHRFSAFYNPEAPITHHYLDSTHIVFGVGTLGFVHKWFKLDASIFTGREPDAARWNFDRPRFDSYSARLSLNPTPDLAFQVSYGFLKSPESIEPNVNVGRATASLSYNRAWEKSNWQITASWGLNMNTPGPNLNAALLESAIQLHKRHVLFGRAEFAQKQELLPGVVKVGKADLGYLFQFPLIPYSLWGIGLLGSASFVSHGYGGTPLSYMAFIRVDLTEREL